MYQLCKEHNSIKSVKQTYHEIQEKYKLTNAGQYNFQTNTY